MGWFRRNRFPLGAWAAISIGLTAVQLWSSRLARGKSLLPYDGMRFYLDGWSQFDGPRYEEIAKLGYSYVPGTASNIVWFPLYPMVMRLAHLLTGDYIVAGVVVTWAGGALATVAFWAWLGDQGLAGTARRCALGVFLFYPYGYYLYGVVYADALFLGLAISAFVLVGRKHLVLGGLVAALATAARPTGLAVIPGLVLLGLQVHGVLVVPPGASGLVQRFALPMRVQRERLRATSFGPLLAVAGIGSYALYLWVRWGHPLLFITNEQLYHPEDKPLLKKAFFYKVLHYGNDPTYATTIIGQALVALLVVACIPAVCRRFGFAYGAYVAVLVAIPTLSTGDFMGTGRYLMAAFPVAALLGERLAERPVVVRRAALGASASLMVFMAWGFSRSWYFT